MSLIVDCSAALAWIYIEEKTPPITAIFNRVIERGAWVPGLWRLEVANVLEMGVRRGRHSSAFRDATPADLSLLPISIDPDTNQHAWGTTLRLAERHRLTLYDAAYPELAAGFLWRHWMRNYNAPRARKGLPCSDERYRVAGAGFGLA